MASIDLLDIPEYFDPINRVEGAISTFLNADWKGACRRYGVILGIMIEFVSSVTSYNAPTIRLRRNAGWKGGDVERLLKINGVNVWDRRLEAGDLAFCVKRRQLKWAERVLRRADVPVTWIEN